MGYKYTVDIRHDQIGKFFQVENGLDESIRTIALKEDVTLIAPYGE